MTRRPCRTCGQSPTEPADSGDPRVPCTWAEALVVIRNLNASTAVLWVLGSMGRLAPETWTVMARTDSMPDWARIAIPLGVCASCLKAEALTAFQGIAL